MIFCDLANMKAQPTLKMAGKINDNYSLIFPLIEWYEEGEINAGQSFLKFLEYPEDESSPVDLRQGVAVFMAHLDCLASKMIENYDDVIANTSNEATTNEELAWFGPTVWTDGHVSGDLSVPSRSLSCGVLDLAVIAEDGLLCVGRNGKLFFLSAKNRSKKRKRSFLHLKISC